MLEAQYLSMIALGSGSFICGMIPLKLSARARNKHPYFLSLLLCFGGGVLLATSMIHMLPEVKEKLNNFAELIFCAGFFFLYAIDELAHYCLSSKSQTLQLGNQNLEPSMYCKLSNSSDEDSNKEERGFYNTKYGTILGKASQASAASDQKNYGGVDVHYHGDTSYSPIPSHSKYDLKEENFCSDLNSYEGGSTSRKLTSTQEDYRSSYKHQHHQSQEPIKKKNSCHVDLGKPCTVTSSGVKGLIIALLVHSILEGISIGVQTNSAEVLLVLAAVACHKLVLSFCLGVELSFAGYESFSFVTAMIIFAAGSPIGIAVGMSLTSASGIEVTAAPLQALAGGSLLYVAAFEVLPRERFNWQHNSNHKAAGIGQLFLVLIGFLVVTLLNVFVVSEHDYFGGKSNGTTGN